MYFCYPPLHHSLSLVMGDVIHITESLILTDSLFLVDLFESLESRFLSECLVFNTCGKRM